MWRRNWFCPAYLKKKRSRSGSPERKPARSSVSRSGLISIRAHQVAQRGSGRSGRAKPLDEVVERFPRQHEARGDDRLGRQLLQGAQVMAQSRLDEVTLLDAGRLDVSLEQVLRLFGHRSGNLDSSAHCLFLEDKSR